MTAEHIKPKGVDTTRTGEIIFVSDDVPLQTILYSIEDIFGNQVYYTEEAEKYIMWRKYLKIIKVEIKEL